MIACRLRLDADADVSRPVAEFVATLAGLTNLTPRQAYRLRLAVDEIATNVVLHGYRDGCGALDLEGGMDAERAWVRIEDDAPPFDPRAHNRVPRQASWSTPRTQGGLGVFLALSSVDEFRYERVRGRNRNTLIIRRVHSMEGGDDARDACVGRR